jgi:hypothetical protein
LRADGIDAALAQPLIADGRLTASQLDCLAAGFALYMQRCSALFARAPGSWFPPRQTNVLIVTAPAEVAPYLEPFAGTSLMLYASDLDTHPEYVAFLFAHGERLALLHTLPAALAANLSYWLERSAAERSSFASAAAAARRPDAAVFSAVAETFAWIDAGYHNPLRVPEQTVAEPYCEVSGTNLFVPTRLQPQLMALAAAAEAGLAAALQGTTLAATPAASTVPHARPALARLCGWLEQTRAHVIITAPDGRVLWAPDAADAVAAKLNAVRSALALAPDDCIASVHADLRVVHERSQTFFAALREPHTLPGYCGVLEADGGVYVDAARRAIVYELRQPGFDPLTAVAPPFHRLLLGARVMHEWGHLAHAARYLRVPETSKPAYRAARAALGACFARVLAAVPAHLRDAVDDELCALVPEQAVLKQTAQDKTAQEQGAQERSTPEPTAREAALAKKTLARIGDYLANLLCARLLPAEEMQAYVRANVRHHFDEELGLVDTLARHAYEVHYLALAGLPRAYFHATSRFDDYLIAPGIVDRDALDALFDAVGRVLACYAFDETKLKI